MATDVALTRIKHGDKDGKVVVIEEFEEVKGLPSDVLKDLKAQGLVGQPPVSKAEADDEKAELEAENEELNTEVADLKAQLAAARASAKQA